MTCNRCGRETDRREQFCLSCGLPCGHGQHASNGGGGVGGASTGLDPKLAALLSYLLGWITGIIFFFIEKNKYVRFHAMQSILTFGVISVLRLAIGFFRGVLGIGGTSGGVYVFLSILGILSTLIWIVALALWVLLMVKAYHGETFRLPLLGDIAAKQLE